MMKVVDSGYKVDLHIHSVSSRGKDKKKVGFNTLDNIPVLADKLNENGVQICAITDHDIFDYDMYTSLKKYELSEDSSIVKVFPGVEFSVEFQGDNGGTVVHVIAIFNDENDEKIQSISSILADKNGNAKYDSSQAFSEERFLGILRSIDLDTVLIAHQKSTLSSKRPNKNDAKMVGEERFNEFVYTDYFEAFEFRNRKNEVFNKNFLNMNNMTGDIRFITGSDCHDWRYYPKENEKDKSEFMYSYLKCLPTFRGLVMAITDHRRIKTVNSFFNPTQVYTPIISLTIDGINYTIPMSRGINVIIGDNSIGKSLLLHTLTGYRKQQEGLLKKAAVAGYKEYLKKCKVEIHTKIRDDEIFAFDMQGEIREKFEQGNLKSDDFFRQFYPSAIIPDAYYEKVQRKLNKIYAYLEEKFALDTKEAQLSRFRVFDEEDEHAESLSFVGKVSKDVKRVEDFNTICSNLDNVVVKLESIMELKRLEEADKSQLKYIAEQLNSMAKRYVGKKKTTEYENERIAIFQSVVTKFKQEYLASVSDFQKKLSTYKENIDKAADEIVELIRRSSSNKIPDFKIENEKIDIITTRVHDYEFNSRLEITEIDEDYIKNLFSSLMKKNTTKTILEMSQAELAEAFSGYTGPPSEVLQAIKERVSAQLKIDFNNKYTITQAGMDCTRELSSGFNSKIYFDILSYETNHRGSYIIDQPEDNISQKQIREHLLDRFKLMGENRQIILVTHNPQFIVNLDVDNVIYIGREEEGLVIYSGALEYRDDKYSILDIISTHIEGGLETLKRRWKRYEKNNSFQTY